MKQNILFINIENRLAFNVRKKMSNDELSVLINEGVFDFVNPVMVIDGNFKNHYVTRITFRHGGATAGFMSIECEKFGNVYEIESDLIIEGDEVVFCGV